MTEFNIFQAMNGNVRRLRHIRRYSSYPCLLPETVAEHSFQVALVSYLIGHDLMLQGQLIDMGRLLTKAITHDLSESMSGDIIRTYKYSSDGMRQACEQADAENMGVFVEDFGAIANELWSDWDRAKNSTLEGQIVRFADLVAVVLYCIEEWHLGNRNLDATLERAYRKDIFAYHQHSLFGRYADQLFPSRNLLKWREAYRLDAYFNDGTKPIMRDHSEGETLEHEWPVRPEALS